MCLNFSAYVTRALIDWMERGLDPQAELAADGRFLLRLGPRFRWSTAVMAPLHIAFCGAGMVFFFLDDKIGDPARDAVRIGFGVVFGLLALLGPLGLLEAFRRCA